MSDIKPEQRIQEAHGLWELQVSRLIGVVEIYVSTSQSREGDLLSDLLRKFSREERVAFENWQRVSKECGA